MAVRVANFVSAEKSAENLLRENSITTAPVPVEDIADSLGLQLLTASFDDPSIQGYIDLERKQIVINERDSPNRQAFTIAHEIGHYVLHRAELASNPDIGVVNRQAIGGETNPIEKEANCFAANLLVPDSLLAKYYRWQPESVAPLFGVSEEVMRYRLRETGRE